MKRSFCLGTMVVAAFLFTTNAEDGAKARMRIIPGQVIVPKEEAMRRIWGELVSVDLATRTGTFRKESTEEVMSFRVLPYAELLHHATFGDLQDFRIGERAIFRMHENDAGEWAWLTYIQDEMNMMNGHKEYFFVDSIDRERSQITVTQANLDKSYVRQKEIQIATDAETRFWKKGERANFDDIEVGMNLRTKTHGVGKGRVRMCWEVFLDDESLLKFQNEQKTVHSKRLREEGAPGYVDVVRGSEVQVTLFQEAVEVSRQVKEGQRVRVAVAGVDRRALGNQLNGRVITASMAGPLGKVNVEVDHTETGLQAANIVRLWIAE